MSGRASAKRQVIQFVAIIAAIVAAFLLLKMYVVTTYAIPSDSMENTIMEGDRVVVLQLPSYRESPTAGDIVTFTDPEDASTTLIKRVIAVGGDEIAFEDGEVYINDEHLVEPYVTGETSPPVDASGASHPDERWEGKLPYGYLWVMGDNREYSKDSRVFGAIPVSSVTGTAVAIYWPFERVGSL